MGTVYYDSYLQFFTTLACSSSPKKSKYSVEVSVNKKTVIRSFCIPTRNGYQLDLQYKYINFHWDSLRNPVIQLLGGEV